MVRDRRDSLGSRPDGSLAKLPLPRHESSVRPCAAIVKNRPQSSLMKICLQKSEWRGILAVSHG
jgi:hypothetical protein